MRGKNKSGQAKMKYTVNTFQEKMDASIANIRDDRKKRASCQETTGERLEREEPTSGDTKACHEATERDTENTEPYPGTMQSGRRTEEAAWRPEYGRGVQPEAEGKDSGKL
jgi:nitrate/TMAO reductase-like tetraheme cytochrome c subunit